MQSNFLAVIFALASALTIAWGTVVRHRIAAKSDPTGSVKDSPIAVAVRNPTWWIGTSTALIGYALQIVALGFGTLLVVQPILVLSLMFTLPLSAWYDKRRMAKDELFWAILLTVAVGVLVIMGQPSAGTPQPPLNKWLPALGVGTVALVSIWFIARMHFFMQHTNKRALLLGILTGGLYGYVAILSKAFADVITHEGFLSLLTAWQGYSLLAGAIIGTIIQQYAFQAGALKNSLPAMTVAEPIVAFCLGYVVLGEKFQVHGWNWSFMALALIVMVISTFALSSRRVG